MKHFIQLTEYDTANPVFIRPEGIVACYIHKHDDDEGSFCTVVYTVNDPTSELRVVETPEDIDAALAAWYAGASGSISPVNLFTTPELAALDTGLYLLSFRDQESGDLKEDHRDLPAAIVNLLTSYGLHDALGEAKLLDLREAIQKGLPDVPAAAAKGVLADEPAQ